MVKKITLMIFILFIFSLSQADEIQNVEEKSFTLKPGSLISLTADEGEIVVDSWDKDEVYLKMTKRAWGRSRKEAEQFLKSITVKIFQSSDKLTIKEVERNHRNFRISDLFDGDFWESGGYGTCIDFELKVPENIDLKINCDEGDVEINSINGDVNIEVDEGDINITRVISEDIQIFVDEGDVYLSEINNSEDGFVNIETDEGEIIVHSGNFGEIDIDSDEGDIMINTTSLYRSWISTDEGDIEVSFHPIENADYRFETDEGDIEVTIPEDSDIDVRLETREGRINTDFDLQIYDRDEGEIADGVIGDKTSYLKVYTDEGYIVLLKKR